MTDELHRAPTYTPEPGWLAADVARAEARIAELEGRTNVAEPMTLAEFQKHAAAQMALYVGGIMDMDETEREFRELGLRLLAGERARCVQRAQHIPPCPFSDPKFVMDPAKPCPHCGDLGTITDDPIHCLSASAAIRSMGDPTT
jgi:hypothetical protein